MNNSAVLFSFGLYVVYVLLPIVPAAILFKMFPDSKVAVSGPLQNLTLNATGAFAAYIVTVALGYFLVQNIKEQIDDLNEKVWTVSVPIQLQDRNGKTISAGNGITDDTVLDFIEHLYRPSGPNLYITVPIDGKKWRTIAVSKTGFETNSVPLQELMDENDHSKVEINAAERTIKVRQALVLKQVSTTPYVETQPLAAKSLTELQASAP